MNNCLILIITYRCNMACDYCHVEKRNLTMPLETAAAAVDEFLATAGPGARIRFFGGEPLLEYPLITEIINHIEKSKHARGTQMDLTTNALLLEEEKISFFRETDRLELILSLDGGEATQKEHRHCTEKYDPFRWLALHGKVLASMPCVTVNKVISPQTSAALAEDFLFLARLDFLRINLLPAYFVPWDDRALRRLQKNLDAVAEITRVLNRHGRAVEIKNVRNAGDYPLFNTGMVVDTDGAIYDTNLSMHRLIYPHRKLLKRGSISGKRRTRPGFTPEQVMKRFIPPEIIEQTKKVDEILNAFVDNLKTLTHSG